MIIQPGTRLGPYEIVTSIGAGGMGEVWRARDTRLDRDVAIKVLPQGFAENEQFLQRFEREARAISQLNHPNVCTLFDVGKEEARDERRETSQDEDPSPLAPRPSSFVHYLVMEYLEGESLADRLKRGPLPLREVLKFGQQIASALDAAHRHGVIHRDLKPGNIMLTKAGAKLLDFGLAKSAAEGVGPVEGLTSFPTEAKPLTQEGTILGTFQYMAPEQLEGLEADARTDIFAYGALLYEMATGLRAFRGETKTSLIASIVSAQPEPISQVTPMSPPALDHVVWRCLEKDPDDRWQSAHDIASELEWISQAGSQAGVGKAVMASRKSRRRLFAALGGLGWLVAVAALIWAFAERSTVERTSRPFRAELVAPEGIFPASVVAGPLAVSPDGSRIVFPSSRGDDLLLAVRQLDTGVTERLSGTEGAIFPFWSPDGRWIGFFADGRLKKIEASGGAVQAIADAPQGRGGAWSDDGKIIFAPDIQGPLYLVSEAGGTPQEITKLEEELVTHRNPHLLPGGKTVLFTDRRSRADRFGSIAASPIDGSSTPRILVEQASNPEYADGFLFWVRDGNLLAQPFDPDSLELSGSPKAIADEIDYYNPRDVGNFSVSASGLLAWRRQNRTPVRLARYDWSGRVRDQFEDSGFFSIEDFSRDGKKVLLSREDESNGTFDLWVMDLERRQMTRSTFSSSSGLTRGAFSPDADRIAVSNYGGGGGWAGSRLWIQPAFGSGEEQQLLDSTPFLVDEWTGDGTYLVGDVQETATAHDIGYLAVADPDKILKFAASPYEEAVLALSPDGKWIVYSSNESGDYEIYLSDFPDRNRKWQISKGDSTGFGSAAEWSLAGDAIYYPTSSGLMRVPFSSHGDRPEPGVPESIELDASTDFGRFQPQDDGFIALTAAGERRVEPIRVIRNWQTLLEEGH